MNEIKGNDIKQRKLLKYSRTKQNSITQNQKNLNKKIHKVEITWKLNKRYYAKDDYKRNEWINIEQNK